MRHACFFTVIFALFAQVASAHATADCGCNSYQKAFEAQITATELARYEAMKGNDLNALEKILGEDLTYTHSTGVKQNKREFLKALETGVLRYRNIAPQAKEIRFLGDKATVNGRGIFQVTAREGDTTRDVTVDLIYTAIYVLRGEGIRRHWQLVSWQSQNAPKE